MSQQLAECTSQLARYDFLLVFDSDIRCLGGYKASNSAETRQIKQLENNNNNNDRLMAFDPGQPG